MGTSDAIVEFLDNFYESIGKYEIFVSVYIDLRKAFDTVNSETLLETVKFPGIQIDSKLNLKCQTEKVLPKISRVAGITWKARLLLPNSIRMNFFFNSLAYSHLMYGILAWGQKCSE